GTGYQRNSAISNNMLDSMGTNESAFDGMFNELANISYQASNVEPNLIRDEFFHEMMEMQGSSQMRGFRGWSVMDLMTAFENLNDVLDLTLMDQSQFPSLDFTQNTEVLGTSAPEDIISQEITMNIMDLMIKYGLGAINFRGSNCDNF